MGRRVGLKAVFCRIVPSNSVTKSILHGVCVTCSIIMQRECKRACIAQVDRSLRWFMHVQCTGTHHTTACIRNHESAYKSCRTENEQERGREGGIETERGRESERETEREHAKLRSFDAPEMMRKAKCTIANLPLQLGPPWALSF